MFFSLLIVFNSIYIVFKYLEVCRLAFHEDFKGHMGTNQGAYGYKYSYRRIPL